MGKAIPGQGQEPELPESLLQGQQRHRCLGHQQLPSFANKLAKTGELGRKLVLGYEMLALKVTALCATELPLFAVVLFC